MSSIRVLDITFCSFLFGRRKQLPKSQPSTLPSCFFSSLLNIVSKEKKRSAASDLSLPSSLFKFVPLHLEISMEGTAADTTFSWACCVSLGVRSKDHCKSRTKALASRSTQPPCSLFHGHHFFLQESIGVDTDRSRPFLLALGSLAPSFWDLKMALFTLNLVPEDREMQWFGLGSALWPWSPE